MKRKYDREGWPRPPHRPTRAHRLPEHRWPSEEEEDMREKIGTVVTIGLTINLLAWTLIGFAYVAAVWGPFALLGLLTALLLVLFVATLPRGVRDDDF